MNVLKVLILLSTAPFFFILDGSRLSFAQFFGYLALLLIWWQIVLGNRFINKIFTKDLIQVNKIHRFLGTYGFFILVTHYALILAINGIDIVTDRSFSGYALGVKFGVAAFYLALGIWLSSALLRKKISWDWWKRLHYAAYPIFFLGVAHSNEVGSSQLIYPSVEYARYVLIATFWIIVILRFFEWAGLAKKTYRVKDIMNISNGVKQLVLEPKGKGIAPAKGQFAYLQYKRFDQAHPFTTSHFNEKTKELSFSIKASGDWTKRLHADLKTGDQVYIDGPYGVFTKEINNTDKQTVVIAGGIGITPFLRWAKAGKIDHLFYGNQTRKDAAFAPQLNKQVKNITHVLSGEEVKGIEHGYVSVDLIKSKLKKDLNQYSFYICGPPPMMNAIEGDLIEANVSADDIHTERFSL